MNTRSASTAPGPPRDSIDHTSTHHTAFEPTSPSGKKTELSHTERGQVANEQEQAALDHVGASTDLAMGSPRRIRIEKRLKLKLDARMSILV
jgi:hypothetical protein